MSRKTALITGASGGLGYEFSKILGSENYDLVLVARNQQKLEEMKEVLEKEFGIQAYVCVADLAVVDAAKEVYQYVKNNDLNVDVLINNAGFGDVGPFLQGDWNRYYSMMQVNMVAMVQLTHCFLPDMVKNKGGKILNVASVAAFGAGPFMSVYYASKAFVMSFSEGLAEELKGTGITVTALCPGPTHTGFAKNANVSEHSKMFSKAAKAKDVAKDGIQAMMKGKVLCYSGWFTKLMGVLKFFFPRCITRKYSASLNK